MTPISYNFIVWKWLETPISLSKQINNFIKKKLAKKGVSEEKWAGWGMIQSWSELNKFLFFHYFKNPKQCATFDFSIFNNALAQESGLKTPN